MITQSLTNYLDLIEVALDDLDSANLFSISIRGALRLGLFENKRSLGQSFGVCREQVSRWKAGQSLPVVPARKIVLRVLRARALQRTKGPGAARERFAQLQCDASHEVMSNRDKKLLDMRAAWDDGREFGRAEAAALIAKVQALGTYRAVVAPHVTGGLTVTLANDAIDQEKDAYAQTKDQRIQMQLPPLKWCEPYECNGLWVSHLLPQYSRVGGSSPNEARREANRSAELLAAPYIPRARADERAKTFRAVSDWLAAKRRECIEQSVKNPESSQTMVTMAATYALAINAIESGDIRTDAR